MISQDNDIGAVPKGAIPFSRSFSPGRERLKSFIFAAILALLIWSPLPAGSVEAWSQLVIEAAAAAMAAAFIFLEPKPHLNHDLTDLLRGSRPFVWGFFGAVALQVVPLPAWLVKFASPAAYTLHAKFDPGFTGAGFLTLSVAPARTIAVGLEMAAYFLIGLIIIRTVNRTSRVRTIIKVLAACGAFQALYGLYELTVKEPRILFYRKAFSPDAVTGTFVNRGHLSGYLEMIVPLALGLIIARMSLFSSGTKGLREKALLWTSKGVMPNLLVAAAVLVMCLGIVFSNSRSGLVVLVFSIFLFFGLSVLVSNRAQYGRPWLRNTVKVAFLLLFVLAFYRGLDTTIDRFASDDLLHENRPLYWSNVVRIIGDFPLFGSGLGTFAGIYPAYEKIGGPEMSLIHAHNEYLEFFSELGLVGSAFLFGLIVFLAAKSFLMWKSRRNPEVKGLALGGLVSLAGAGLHACTDFNLHIPANIVLFVVVLCLTTAVSYQARRH